MASAARVLPVPDSPYSRPITERPRPPVLMRQRSCTLTRRRTRRIRSSRRSPVWGGSTSRVHGTAGVERVARRRARGGVRRDSSSRISGRLASGGRAAATRAGVSSSIQLRPASSSASAWLQARVCCQASASSMGSLLPTSRRRRWAPGPCREKLGGAMTMAGGTGPEVLSCPAPVRRATRAPVARCSRWASAQGGSALSSGASRTRAGAGAAATASTSSARSACPERCRHTPGMSMIRPAARRMLAAGRAGGTSWRTCQPAPASAGARPSRPASRVSVGSRRRSSRGRRLSSERISPVCQRGEARKALRTACGSARSPNSSLRARPTVTRRGPPVRVAMVPAASSSKHGSAARASRSRSKPDSRQPLAMRARGSASGRVSRAANRVSALPAMASARCWGVSVARWGAARRSRPGSSGRRSSRRPAARASHRSSRALPRGPVMTGLRSAGALSGLARAASPGPGPSRRGAGPGRWRRGARSARRPRG